MKGNVMLFSQSKYLVVLGMLAAFTAQAQEKELRLSLSNFDRGNMSDVFRGAQLRVNLELVYQNDKGKVVGTEVIAVTEDVVIPNDKQKSDEVRALQVNADQLEDLLKRAPRKASSAKLQLRFLEIDYLKNDQIKVFDLANASLKKDEVRQDAESLVSSAQVRMRDQQNLIDWEEIKIHYYQVSVTDYRTETEWGYHYGYNYSSGEFDFHFGPHSVTKAVGSHLETRSMQTGGGTKASFDVKAE